MIDKISNVKNCKIITNTAGISSMVLQNVDGATCQYDFNNLIVIIQKKLTCTI